MDGPEYEAALVDGVGRVRRRSQLRHGGPAFEGRPRSRGRAYHDGGRDGTTPLNEAWGQRGVPRRAWLSLEIYGCPSLVGRS